MRGLLSSPLRGSRDLACEVGEVRFAGFAPLAMDALRGLALRNSRGHFSNGFKGILVSPDFVRALRDFICAIRFNRFARFGLRGFRDSP